MNTITRRAAMTASALLLLGGAVTTVPASAAPTATTQAATSCNVMWGSLAKTKNDTRLGDGTITNVRSGRHACFDRMVIDLAGVSASKVGYSVAYVDKVTEPGSGREVPLAGGARMEVRVTVPAYDSNGNPTYNPRDRKRVVNVTGYDTFRQVAFAGSFEGQTTFGLGVRARLPMQVFLLEGPGSGSRMVIDVAHQW